MHNKQIGLKQREIDSLRILLNQHNIPPNEQATHHLNELVCKQMYNENSHSQQQEKVKRSCASDINQKPPKNSHSDNPPQPENYETMTE